MQFVFPSMYLCIYIATHLHMVYLDWMQAVVESNSRCAWKWRSSELSPWSSEFGDTIGDRDWVNSEMHWEAVIERVWRCTWRPRSSELRDALWGRDRASLEMQLETEIEWTLGCIWRPWSSELGDALGNRDRASLEMQFETEIEWTQRYTPTPWSSEFRDALGGRNRASLETHWEAEIKLNSEMHLEAVIERVWRCTWIPRPSWTQRCTWRP